MRGRGGGGQMLVAEWLHVITVRGRGANACVGVAACDNNEWEEGRTNFLGGESACEQDERRSGRKK